jgi:hypothetical protein
MSGRRILAPLWTTGVSTAWTADVVDRSAVQSTPTHRVGPVERGMLKGTRNGILRRMQPVSIHGQISWDLFFTDADDPDGQLHAARLGPESLAQHLEAGDRIQVEYLVGVPVRVTRAT